MGRSKKISIKYPDDGAFGEGFSDKVAWLFQNKYSDFHKKEIFKDSKFFEFIKRHIDETWVYGSVDKLKIKIENDCPKGHKVICEELLESLDKVINDHRLDIEQSDEP